MSLKRTKILNSSGWWTPVEWTDCSDDENNVLSDFIYLAAELLLLDSLEKNAP
jgi:hypothetical protein